MSRTPCTTEIDTDTNQERTMNQRPITITATLKAWTTGNYSFRSVMDALHGGNAQEAAENLVFSNAEMDKGDDPWTHIGDADVTVRLRSQDEMVAAQLQTLQKELDQARAEWLTKQKEILDRINKLQALPMAGEVEPAIVNEVDDGGDIPL